MRYREESEHSNAIVGSFCRIIANSIRIMCTYLCTKDQMPVNRSPKRREWIRWNAFYAQYSTIMTVIVTIIARAILYHRYTTVNMQDASAPISPGKMGWKWIGFGVDESIVECSVSHVQLHHYRIKPLPTLLSEQNWLWLYPSTERGRESCPFDSQSLCFDVSVICIWLWQIVWTFCEFKVQSMNACAHRWSGIPFAGGDARHHYYYHYYY